MSDSRKHDDGSAGDADYGRLAPGYSDYRRPDPRIAAEIERALGDAITVVNVGAGAGSYEPIDRVVTAVEPSASMRALRAADHPAIDAVAEALPFPDDSFDAGMSTFSVHQWPDAAAGLRELRRVVRGPIAILTLDPVKVPDFWLNDYVPEVVSTEASRYPELHQIERALGGHTRVVVVRIPFGCIDGFNQAYYGRPERLLDPGARKANSAWSFVDPSIEVRFTEELTADLESGAWDARYGELRHQPDFDGGLRLVVSRP